MSDDLQPKDYSPENLLDQILAKKEEELIPWQEVTLPSQGLYYDGRIPGGVVEVRPMGLYADKALATARLVKTGKAIEYIFQHCVRLPDPDFELLDLLSDDRIYLLYILRGITHGNDYEFFLKCPACDNNSQHEYDLNDLWETLQAPPKDIEGSPLVEPFKIVLPYLSEQVGEEFWITVRFLRGKDSMDFMGANSAKELGPRKARNRKNRGRPVYDPMGERSEDLDETLEKNINRVIVSAMGVKDRHKIRALVERLHSEDISVITEWLRMNSPGIDTSIETDCPHCNAVIAAPLPVSESFFRPKKRRRPRP